MIPAAIGSRRTGTLPQPHPRTPAHHPPLPMIGELAPAIAPRPAPFTGEMRAGSQRMDAKREERFERADARMDRMHEATPAPLPRLEVGLASADTRIAGLKDNV